MFPVFSIEVPYTYNSASKFSFLNALVNIQQQRELDALQAPEHFLKYFIDLVLERGREGEREGEKYYVWLPLMRPLLGTWPATQACALTGDQTGDALVCRPALNPLSPPAGAAPGHLM